MSESNPPNPQSPPPIFNPYEPNRDFTKSFDIKSREPEYVRRAELEEQAKQADFQREQEAHDASFRRWGIAGLTLTVIAIIGFALHACFRIANDPNATEDAQKAATAAIASVLTSTVTGIVGFLAGANATKKSS